MNVAEIIAFQIKTIDPLAFFSWGTTDLTEFSPTEEHLGALRFKVRNFVTFKGSAFVRVTLNFDDTYTVKLYKHRNYTKTLRTKVLEDNYSPKDLERIITELSGIYADQLVPTIDTILGERTKG